MKLNKPILTFYPTGFVRVIILKYLLTIFVVLTSTFAYATPAFSSTNYTKFLPRRDTRPFAAEKHHDPQFVFATITSMEEKQRQPQLLRDKSRRKDQWRNYLFMMNSNGSHPSAFLSGEMLNNLISSHPSNVKRNVDEDEEDDDEVDWTSNQIAGSGLGRDEDDDDFSNEDDSSSTDYDYVEELQKAGAFRLPTNDAKSLWDFSATPATDRTYCYWCTSQSNQHCGEPFRVDATSAERDSVSMHCVATNRGCLKAILKDGQVYRYCADDFLGQFPVTNTCITAVAAAAATGAESGINLTADKESLLHAANAKFRNSLRGATICTCFGDYCNTATFSLTISSHDNQKQLVVVVVVALIAVLIAIV